MTDQARLLEKLRIPRDPRAEEDFLDRPRRRWWRWIVLAVVVLGIAGYAIARRRGPPTVNATVAAARTAAEVVKPGSPVLEASGYVVARRQASVSARVAGRVSEVLVEEGQSVAEGQVMARLDATSQQAQMNLVESQETQAVAQKSQARAQAAELEASLGAARRELARNQGLVADGFISAQALDQNRTQVAQLEGRLGAVRASVGVADSQIGVAQRQVAVAKQGLNDLEVRAPFAGRLIAKTAQPGEIISPAAAGGSFTRTGIGTLVDMTSLEIEVDVAESFIEKIRPGQPVTARLNAYPDFSIPSHVAAIVPTADRAKATVKVRVAFDASPPDPRILPDMGVRVSVLAAPLAPGEKPPPPKTGVWVPSLAVHGQNPDATVQVLDAQGLARTAKATVAETGATETRLSAGVAVGQKVVVSETPVADGARVVEKADAAAAGGKR